MSFVFAIWATVRYRQLLRQYLVNPAVVQQQVIAQQVGYQQFDSKGVPPPPVYVAQPAGFQPPQYEAQGTQTRVDEEVRWVGGGDEGVKWESDDRGVRFVSCFPVTAFL